MSVGFIIFFLLMLSSLLRNFVKFLMSEFFMIWFLFLFFGFGLKKIIIVLEYRRNIMKI